jgi:aspartyl-tRNA(Asn)/glutamyl-tRNA(Gln) amidotransferase subunit C
MKINTELIDKLADLAQLEFEENAKKQMQEDLQKILKFVDKLDEINTDNIEPLVYMSKEVNVLRKDEVIEHLPKEVALKNAPDKNSDYFKVPTVLKK